MSDADAATAGSRLRPLWLFLATFCVLAATSRGTITNPDTHVRYLVSERIWEDGSVHPLPADLRATGGSFGEGRNGDPISPHGLGQSVFLLPAVAVADLISRQVDEPRREEVRTLGGQLLYKVFLLPLWGALAVLAIFRLARRLELDSRVALWTAIAAGFGTFWWYYAKTAGHELEATTLLLWGLVSWRTEVGIGRAAAAGLLLGATFLYRVEFVIPVGLIGLIFVFQVVRKEGRFVPALALLVPMVLCCFVVLWHNFERTGHILDAGQVGALEGADRHVLAEYPAKHLFALTIGWSRGFLWYSPLFFAFALFPLAGGQRWPRVFACGIPVLLLFAILVGSIDSAPHADGWGPRYLLPITPFLVLGLTVVMTPLLDSRRWRRVLATFVVVNVLLQGFLTFYEHGEVHRQTAKVSERAEWAGRPEMVPRGWRRSEWAATLRNYGIPLGDTTAVVASWAEPEIASLRTGVAANLWWWQLGRRSGSKGIAIALMAVGVLLSIAGAWFCHLALRPARSSIAGREDGPTRWLPGRQVPIGVSDA